MAAIAPITVFAAVVLMGCTSSSKPPPPPKAGPAYSYTIVVDPSLQGASFQVDVLALNASDKQALENVPIPDYFAPDSQVRASAPVIQKYLMSTQKTEAIDLSQPDYKKYRFPGYSYIAVFANVPGEVTGVGNKDPRRLLLPLDPAKWQPKWPNGKREITITITRSLGIRCDPSWFERGQ